MKARLSKMGCNKLYLVKIFLYDPYIESKLIKNNNCFPISFEEGIKIADFISIHLPLNKETKYLITKKLQYTYRLIDDITSLNSDGYFAEYVKNIYPDCLTLNKENTDDNRANVLDLDISIDNYGKFGRGIDGVIVCI